MMTRERAEQIALMVLIVAVLMVASFYGIILPQWSRLRHIRSESQQVKATLADARAKVDALPRLMQQCHSLETSVAEQEQQLVGDGSFDGYLALIKRCADNAGMTLNTVQLRSDVTVPRGTTYTERWVTIETYAAYHTIGTWLALLEQASPFVRLVGASVRSGAAPDGQHAATITVAFLAKQTKP